MTRLVLIVTILGAAACGSRVAPPAPEPLFDGPVVTPTSRDDLVRTVSAMEARLARNAADVDAAVRLSEALLRQARVTGNGGLARRAEAALMGTIERRPDAYSAQRMLGAVYLSLHRFDDAIDQARRCLAQRPNDAWTYGVLGDGLLERGEYDAAFDAFDRMLSLRPSAAAYARASYARELSGDLDGAVRLMTLALEATSPHDPEGQAWHHAQLGHLQLERGKVADARREYAHALFIFGDHPLAVEGLARTLAAESRHAEALVHIERLIAVAPTPAALVFAGDLQQTLGRQDDAERMYRLAEAAWESDAPEPAQLALFLADRGRRLDDAVRIAEDAARTRHDIATNHALALAYFKTGRIADANRAMTRALRTGSRDRVLRQHAGAISRAAVEVDTR
jgi:tetratricopeptide (TPR) repeat protein